MKFSYSYHLGVDNYADCDSDTSCLLNAFSESVMVEAAVEPKWGELLFCGGSDWSKIGRQDKKKTAESEERSLKYPPLSGPHRLSTLKGVKVTFVAAGSGKALSYFC